MSDKWHAVFKSLIGLHVCNTCRKSIYEKKDDPDFKVCISKHNMQQENTSEETEEENNPDQEEKNDPTFRCDDYEEKEKITKINDVLRELGEPLIKKRRMSQLTGQDIANSSAALQKFTNSKKCVIGNDFETLFIHDIKVALSQQPDRSGKIQILTTLPSHWTIAAMRREFGISRRMASKAKKLRIESGFGARLKKKQGAFFQTLL